MSEGGLQRILHHEIVEGRRTTLYEISLAVAILVVLIAMLVSASAITFVNG